MGCRGFKVVVVLEFEFMGFKRGVGMYWEMVGRYWVGVCKLLVS